MPFHVETTARAERDFWECYSFIRSRNADGARRWADAFEDAWLTLERDPNRGLAPENEDASEEVRQKMFKTRYGLTYRLLFVIRGNVVHIIHVRGPGQDIMTVAELELPDADTQ